MRALAIYAGCFLAGAAAAVAGLVIYSGLFLLLAYAVEHL